MTPATIPYPLRRNIAEIWGVAGEQWLSTLPALIDDIVRDWSLEIGPPYALSLNWVAPATRADGSGAVVKLGVPDGHLDREAEALRSYDGYGATRLLAEDLGRGALLLERVSPGTMAAELVPDDDEAATAALITVGKRLHRAPPAGCTLPHLRKESASFRDHLRRFPGDDPLPRRLVSRAGGLFDDLCSSAVDTLLHGDLHHDNVLRATREPWLAIDPHGVIGDPGYDCGAMLYNPDPARRTADLLSLVPARIEHLADGYGMPVDRVVAWGLVMGVLSEVWTAQVDGSVGGRALDVARLLDRRIR
jgi:streptomycin 6-kinase